MNTLNKTEEEKMREAFEVYWNGLANDSDDQELLASCRHAAWYSWKAAIAHANTQHSKIIEDLHESYRSAEYGWCPCCNKIVPILPEPACGNCVFCYNHTMKLFTPDELEAEYVRGKTAGECLDQAKHSKIVEDYDRIARVAEKQAKEIVGLQLQLSAANVTAAMLRNELKYALDFYGSEDFDFKRGSQALNNTQAAADAFMAEHDAKMLDRIIALRDELRIGFWGAFEVRRSELRASANKKG